MMILKQDINLYQKQEELAPWLSATRLVQIWGFLFTILLVVAIQHKWVAKNEAKNIEALKAQQQDIDAQLIKLSHQIKVKRNDPQARDNLIQLRERVKMAEKAIIQLKEEGSKTYYPLSSYLEGFAEQHVKGTFISHFYIEKTSKKLLFEGIALEPRLVPLMMQSWEKAPPMVGKGFQKFKIQQIKTNGSSVQFNLQAE